MIEFEFNTSIILTHTTTNVPLDHIFLLFYSIWFDFKILANILTYFLLALLTSLIISILFLSNNN